MVLATIAQDTAVSIGVPRDILESILRDHLDDQSARITECVSTPFLHQGTNDSNRFFRVTFSWRVSFPGRAEHPTTWIIKHWRAGGVRDSMLGIRQPREVLAWKRGLLRPTSLPDGIVVPIIGAWRSEDKTEAWLAMADVSAELSAYPRMALSGDQVLSRARAILARLAHFHAAWEQPERQAELQTCSWLQRPEKLLWEQAHTYARALGRPPAAHMPQAASGPPAWDGLSADLEAFLDARPADERQLWEKLMIDRRVLVEALAAYPPTLLHNDLDDRNIGLRWSGDGAVNGSPTLGLPELVLIDWEWIAIGPAALDVAKIVRFLPIVTAPGTPIPQAFWNDELADYYFAQYRAAGGTYADGAGWRRSYGLAIVAQAVAQMPSIHGRMLRSIRGELPPPEIVGVPEEVVRANLSAGLPMMKQMEEQVIREARRWLG